ncbi:putative Cyclin fold protein 1 [Giardia muris]|uniref:Putative Cyclin fold protein 1 n=1 Tax=Giardia muris TaxID=5742 RepID=A0A4Z1TAW8_GIAMU|nr:putative Cyclin fold protein 1 [Giardia muris]|eukprot:TNJ29679.1 putative Cyclin fold protein 1 [Giardia muris]
MATAGKMNMTVKGVAAAIYGMVLEAHAQRQESTMTLTPQTPSAQYGVFRSTNFVYHSRVPTFKEVYTYIYKLFRKAQVEPECLVAAIIYLQAFLALPHGLRITSETWERLTFVFIMIASKVWDDISCSSRSFALCASDFSLRDLNTMERVVSRDLGFNYFLTANDYKEFYYRLKDIWLNLTLTESMDIIPKSKVPAPIDGELWGMKYVFLHSWPGTRKDERVERMDLPVIKERLPIAP